MDLERKKRKVEKVSALRADWSGSLRSPRRREGGIERNRKVDWGSTSITSRKEDGSNGGVGDRGNRGLC